MRYLLGAVVPLLAVFLAWSIGTPPPKSVFWAKAQGEITGHQTQTFETGFGPADFTNPVVQLDEGGERILEVDNVHDAAAVEAEWPAGKRVSLRPHPDGQKAFDQEGDAPDFWVAAIITAGGLFILIFFVRSFMVEAGGTELFLAGVGACFIMLPLILLRFMWSFGDPPATSLFWPVESVTVVSNEVTGRPWAGGRIAYTADIVVERGTGETASIKTVGKAEDTARQFSPGTVHTVRRSPDGGLYERALRFPFLLAFFMSLIGPCAMAAGAWVILRIFRQSRDPSG